jgi:hypothetical protein
MRGRRSTQVAGPDSLSMISGEASNGALSVSSGHAGAPHGKFCTSVRWTKTADDILAAIQLLCLRPSKAEEMRNQDICTAPG